MTEGLSIFKWVDSRSRLIVGIRFGLPVGMNDKLKNERWENLISAVEKLLKLKRVARVIILIPRDENFSYLLLDDGSTLGRLKRIYGKEGRVTFREIRQNGDLYRGLLNWGAAISANQYSASHFLVMNPEYVNLLDQDTLEQAISFLRDGKLVVEIGTDIPGLSKESMSSGLLNNSLTFYNLEVLLAHGAFGYCCPGHHPLIVYGGEERINVGAEGIWALTKITLSFSKRRAFSDYNNIFAFVPSSEGVVSFSIKMEKQNFNADTKELRRKIAREMILAQFNAQL